MPEMHLRELGFTFSACGQKIKKELENLKKQEVLITFIKKLTW